MKHCDRDGNLFRVILTKIFPPSFWIILCLIAAMDSSLFAIAQEQNTPQSSQPFDPAETQHGFFEFDSLPPNPSDTPPNPLPYYKDLKDVGVPGHSTPDQKPEGLFLKIELAEDFEEDLEFRRGNLYYPVRPTDRFSTDASAVYVVFRVFKHYQAYQVIGQVYPDTVEGVSGKNMIDQDMAYLALEDESGYLKFFPPTEQGWKPGQYYIDIFVGYEANQVSKMGTLRFRVTENS